MSQSVVSLQSMAVIDGRYVLVRPLGDGAFGDVWLATDERLGRRPVAIKVLRAEHLTSEAMVQRFQNEAVALAYLQHPNIVGAIDRGVYGALPYFVMEYVEGVTLASWLDGFRTAGAPPAKRLAGLILAQVADAVAAAHGLRPAGPVIHRDLKPANILLTLASGDSPRVKVLDFGIAQLGDRSATQTGAVLGTLGYMAPE